MYWEKLFSNVLKEVIPEVPEKVIPRAIIPGKMPDAVILGSGLSRETEESGYFWGTAGSGYFRGT